MAKESKQIIDVIAGVVSWTRSKKYLLKFQRSFTQKTYKLAKLKGRMIPHSRYICKIINNKFNEIFSHVEFFSNKERWDDLPQKGKRSRRLNKATRRVSSGQVTRRVSLDHLGVGPTRQGHKMGSARLGHKAGFVKSSRHWFH